STTSQGEGFEVRADPGRVREQLARGGGPDLDLWLRGEGVPPEARGQAVAALRSRWGALPGEPGAFLERAGRELAGRGGMAPPAERGGATLGKGRPVPSSGPHEKAAPL